MQSARSWWDRYTSSLFWIYLLGCKHPPYLFYNLYKKCFRLSYMTPHFTLQFCSHRLNGFALKWIDIRLWTLKNCKWVAWLIRSLFTHCLSPHIFQSPNNIGTWIPFKRKFNCPYFLQLSIKGGLALTVVKNTYRNGSPGVYCLSIWG